MAKIKTIGILTSGGDAPGMNAAIRAVTRAGIYNGFNIKAVYRGYDGLINDEIVDFTTENVSGIINQGGTILKTARSSDFMTDEGKKKAYDNIVKEGIDALVVIGGNGSLTGAMIFAQESVCAIEGAAMMMRIYNDKSYLLTAHAMIMGKFEKADKEALISSK